MPITIKDIAAELDLDHSTVGYALTGKGTIKEATRRQVLDAAARMGYLPNRMARQMRTARSGVVGIVLPNVVLGYNETVQHMFRHAGQCKYDLQIALTEFDGAREEKALRTFLELGVDAIILKTTYPKWREVPPESALRLAVTRGVPVTVFGYAIESGPFSNALRSNVVAGWMLAEHLLERGHRRLACLAPMANPSNRPFQDIVSGVREANPTGQIESLDIVTGPDGSGSAALPAQKGSGSNPIYHQHVNSLLMDAGIEAGKELLRHALKLASCPTGLIFHNEMSAIGAIMEARNQGLRMPEDVAICAATRNQLAALSPVSLTTVESNLDEAAERMLDFTLKHLTGEVEWGSTLNLEQYLIIGDSTGG